MNMKENEQNKANTTVVNRHIVFLKDDAGWYASYWKNAIAKMGERVIRYASFPFGKENCAHED